MNDTFSCSTMYIWQVSTYSVLSYMYVRTYAANACECHPMSNGILLFKYASMRIGAGKRIRTSIHT